MPYEPYEYIDEQLGFPHQATGHRPKQRLAQRDILAASQAERQARIEAQARARNFQGGGDMRPDRLPSVRQRPDEQDDELYEGDELDTRPPRSQVRYQPVGTYRSGIQGANVNFTSPPPAPANGRHAIPPRKSAAYTPPPTQPYQQEEYGDDVDAQVQARPRRKRIPAYWLILLGIALFLMITGYMAFTDLGGWWQNHTDDATYGMPRTFQIDAVVGHSDSNTNPSHFIAINLHGAIYVIEAPGGNFTKARGYFITTEVGGNPNPPVTIKFEDITHDGKLDMVVTVGDPPNALVVFLFNNGSQFTGKQQ